METAYGEELQSLYHSPNIVTVIQARGISWAGHEAKIEEDRSAFEILTGGTASLAEW